MKVLILGAKGQIGSSILEQVSSNPALNWEITAWSRDDFDFSDLSLLSEKLTALPALDLIINAAAYTQVDSAEKNQAVAETLNAKLPELLANECRVRTIPLIHYSTDYVYPGTGSKPWVETDALGPINAYGKTKAAGDLAIQASGCSYLILRTSWVYLERGNNFLRTMLKLGLTRDPLSIVQDQVGAPSYARDLARMSIQMIQKSMSESEFHSGIYHLCNLGETSWYGFAEEIFRQVKEKGWPLTVQMLKPISSEEYPTPARRPKNSRLALDRLKADFSIQPRSWQAALQECMEEVDRKRSDYGF